MKSVVTPKERRRNIKENIPRSQSSVTSPGFTAPEGKTMGHAGAIVSGSSGTRRREAGKALETGRRQVGKLRRKPPPHAWVIKHCGPAPRLLSETPPLGYALLAWFRPKVNLTGVSTADRHWPFFIFHRVLLESDLHGVILWTWDQDSRAYGVATFVGGIITPLCQRPLHGSL